MGRMYAISCKNCGERWECKTGCGLMHGRFSHAVEAFPEEIRGTIQADMSGCPLVLFDFGYQVTGCRHCGNVVSVPVLKLIEKERVIVGPCPECGELIGAEELWTGQSDEMSTDQPDERRIEGCDCPACQEKALSVQLIGLWD